MTVHTMRLVQTQHLEKFGYLLICNSNFRNPTTAGGQSANHTLPLKLAVC